MINYLKPPHWIDVVGPEGDIVLTSRVRLARNLKEYPFPHQCSSQQRTIIARRFKNLVMTNPYFSDYAWVNFDSLSMLERLMLLEEHVISPAFSRENAEGRAVAFNSSKNESVMVNEEDHLRMQVIEPGLDLKKGWMSLNRMDDEIESEIDYAFSTEFGYKTSCLSNLGSGLRVSLMVHLPAISLSQQMPSLMQYLVGLGFVVRGIFGEGTDIMGNLVQISNQWSFGLSEDDIISDVQRAARHVIKKERATREMILFELPRKIPDQVFRNFALIKSARLLSFPEFMDRYSIVRMGVEMGILEEIPRRILNQLMLEARPAFLQAIYGVEENQEILDELRARHVRKMLEDFEVK